MTTSQNGYRANDQSVTDVYTVPGTSVRLRLRKGPCASALLFCAQQWNERVERLDPSECWSYAERMVRGSTSTVSNHASGTAIDLNASKHGRGESHTFTSGQIRTVRAILAQVKDPVTDRPVVRWGQDYANAPTDGMHLEINADEAAVRRAVANMEDNMPLSAADIAKVADAAAAAVHSQQVFRDTDGSGGPYTFGDAAHSIRSIAAAVVALSQSVAALTAKVDALTPKP